MKITGEMLKSERINNKLSIQDVALSLKLSSKIILAIEAGSIDDLPSKTFVRGFVKSYAQLLKIDADVVLRQFQEEMGSTNPLPKVPPPIPEPNKNNIKAPRPALKQTAKNYSAKNAPIPASSLNNENPKKIVLMISIAALLIVFLVISNKIIDGFRANPVAVDAPIETTATTPSSTALTESSTQNNTDHNTDKSPVGLPNAVDSRAVVPATSMEEGFEKSAGKPVEVLLEAKKDTELFYAKGDAKQFVSLKLSISQIQILRSKVGLYLKAADGGAFKISVNGIEMGFAGGNNKAIKLSF